MPHQAAPRRHCRAALPLPDRQTCRATAPPQPAATHVPCRHRLALPRPAGPGRAAHCQDAALPRRHCVAPPGRTAPSHAMPKPCQAWIGRHRLPATPRRAMPWQRASPSRAGIAKPSQAGRAGPSRASQASRHCPALPCLASSDGPSHAVPSHASPALLRTAAPGVALPRHASPSRAWPSQAPRHCRAGPRLATPGWAMPALRCQDVQSRAARCHAAPHLAGIAGPSPARPGCAMPSRAPPASPVPRHAEPRPTWPRRATPSRHRSAMMRLAMPGQAVPRRHCPATPRDRRAMPKTCHNDARFSAEPRRRLPEGFFPAAAFLAFCCRSRCSRLDDVCQLDARALDQRAHFDDLAVARQPALQVSLGFLQQQQLQLAARQDVVDRSIGSTVAALSIVY